MPRIERVALGFGAQRTASMLVRQNFRAPCHQALLQSLAMKVVINPGLSVALSPLITVPFHLARISHQLSTAGPQRCALTALRLIWALNVLQACLRAQTIARLVTMHSCGPSLRNPVTMRVCDKRSGRVPWQLYPQQSDF